MTDVTWLGATSGNYNTETNWSTGSVPVSTDNAVFTGSASTFSIIVSGSDADIGAWTFSAGAYTVEVDGTFLSFEGAGIVDGELLDLTNNHGLLFFNSSSAGAATITNNFLLEFSNASSAGSAVIVNESTFTFVDNSSADEATITNNSNTTFSNASTAANATITNTSNLVFGDLSTAGSSSINNSMELGFISEADAGTATITSNGELEFQEESSAANASITNNGNAHFRDDSTLAEATIINNGFLDFDSSSLTGTGQIIFGAASNATLQIENASLLNGAFLYSVSSMNAGDVIDLSELAFVNGATATYKSVNHHLSVTSNGVTDTLTLLNLSGTAFVVANDGNGGTRVSVSVPDKYEVSIDDAVPVNEGSSVTPSTAHFTVRLNKPWTEATALVVGITSNPTSDQLAFKNSQYGFDWTLGTPGEGSTFVTFAQGDTEKTVNVAIGGDSFIEASKEFFSVKASITSAPSVPLTQKKDVAIGTILDDDNTQPLPGYHLFAPLPSSIANVKGPDGIDYLSRDLSAAIDRIKSFLPDLPDLSIKIEAASLPKGVLAAGSPWVMTFKDTYVPKALIKYQYEKDAEPTAYDVKIELSPTVLATIYSGTKDASQGGTTVDVPTILAHEILHGLGFGIGTGNAKLDLNTIWDLHLVLSPSGKYLFQGDEAGNDVLLAAGATGDVASHLDPSMFVDDLMNPSYVTPSNIAHPRNPSDVDIHILHDLGYSSAQKVANDDTTQDNVYVVATASDGNQISESSDNGLDTVYSAISLTLPDNVEDLILTGSATTGTGNSQNNSIFGNAIGNNLSGLDGNDSLFGFQGNDVLVGGAGTDLLLGGPGKDRLTGGGDSDNFDFKFVTESPRGANHDIITDFVHNIDDVDLADIDANSKLGGDQQFKFIGVQAFHHKSGELHYVKQNLAGVAHDKTIIEGDINGDGRADFQIELTGLKAISAADFLL